MQIGDYHIGKAETATKPTLDINEASLIWDLLVARYLCIEETQIYYNLAHDPEFKKTIDIVGIRVLEKQTSELEKQMNLYNLPLPKRPPKSHIQTEDTQVMSDQFIFTKIFRGCQSFIYFHAHAISSMVTNDSLRTTVTNFLNEEMMVFDKLIKYGKQKGWIEPPPLYKN